MKLIFISLYLLLLTNVFSNNLQLKSRSNEVIKKLKSSNKIKLLFKKTKNKENHKIKLLKKEKKLTFSSTSFKNSIDLIKIKK